MAAPSPTASAPMRSTPHGPLVAAASAGPTASNGSQLIPVPPVRARSATAAMIRTGTPAAKCRMDARAAGRRITPGRDRATGSPPQSGERTGKLLLRPVVGVVDSGWAHVFVRGSLPCSWHLRA